MAVGVALLNGRWVGDNVINSVGVAVVFVGLPKNYRPKRRNAQRTPRTSDDDNSTYVIQYNVMVEDGRNMRT